MQYVHSKRLRHLLTLLVCVLIIKVTLGVVLNYRNYLPPNFGSDFLLGRESYFRGSYQWAFYTHIATGPCTLLFGMVLLSDEFRRRFPAWHRYLGRIQTACILLLMSPSGFVMAFHAQTGAIAGVGFATLAVATGLCVGFGWRSAVKRRFVEHRRWMSRCFVLLCSAVVLRLIAGVATVTGIEGDWIYPMAAWTSWLVPLAVYELTASRRGRSQLTTQS